jgi:hypothetical protein
LGTYDTFGFSLALLEGVLVLELGSHIDREVVLCEVGLKEDCWWLEVEVDVDGGRSGCVVSWSCNGGESQERS